MSIFSPFISAWNWFKKTFVDHTQSAASVAFVVTQTVKTLLANPVANFLENIADTVTGTQIATNAANAINALIPKVMALELGIEGLPDNPTQADILAFEQRIMSAFNVTDNNSKLYTVLAAQIYGIIQNTLNNTSGNFVDWVSAVQQAYLDYKADLNANATATTSVKTAA